MKIRKFVKINIAKRSCYVKKDNWKNDRRLPMHDEEHNLGKELHLILTFAFSG